ncbi:MAG TPA: hypothetical protein PLL10_04640 [Elusimicrobiales bacterium]|nr:hypothetical protein [Elusimicrobiales bacterium]
MKAIVYLAVLVLLSPVAAWSAENKPAAKKAAQHKTAVKKKMVKKAVSKEDAVKAARKRAAELASVRPTTALKGITVINPVGDAPVGANDSLNLEGASGKSAEVQEMEARKRAARAKQLAEERLREEAERVKKSTAPASVPAIKK